MTITITITGDHSTTTTTILMTMMMMMMMMTMMMMTLNFNEHFLSYQMGSPVVPSFSTPSSQRVDQVSAHELYSPITQIQFELSFHSTYLRPGKLNKSYWEERVRAETRLPPRTPPPRRRLRDMDERMNAGDRCESFVVNAADCLSLKVSN